MPTSALAMCTLNYSSYALSHGLAGCRAPTVLSTPKKGAVYLRVSVRMCHCPCVLCRTHAPAGHGPPTRQSPLRPPHRRQRRPPLPSPPPVLTHTLIRPYGRPNRHIRGTGLHGDVAGTRAARASAGTRGRVPAAVWQPDTALCASACGQPAWCWGWCWCGTWAGCVTE